jgi:hypothetical protein
MASTHVTTLRLSGSWNVLAVPQNPMDLVIKYREKGMYFKLSIKLSDSGIFSVLDILDFVILKAFLE